MRPAPRWFFQLLGQRRQERAGTRMLASDDEMNTMRGGRPASSSCPRGTAESRLVWTAGAMITVLLIVLAIPLFTGCFFPMGDLGQLHLPARYFCARCLANGDSFLWMPNLFCGFYMQGEGQAGMSHPLHLVLYGFLPLLVAFNLELLANYLFMLPGMYLFLRRWRLPRFASLFGAMVFTFSGFNLLHFLHLNMVGVVAHIPWMLWAINVALKEQDRRKAALGQAALAILTASQLLLGFPQMIWFTLILEVMYVALLLPNCVSLRRVALLALAQAFGAMMGAIQLLPTLAAISTSPRAGTDVSFRYMDSMWPGNLLQVFGAYFFGIYDRAIGGEVHEVAPYAGAATVALVFWVLLSRRASATSPDSRRLVRWTVFVGVLGIILALGKYGYLYRLQVYLPVVGLFRCPGRYILFSHFAGSVLAAVAIAALQSMPEAQRREVWRRDRLLALLPVVSAAAAAFLLLCRWFPPKTGLLAPLAFHIGGIRYIAVSVTFIAVAVIMVLFASRARAWALVGIIVFAAVDQGAYGFRYMWEDGPISLQAYLRQESAPPVSAGGRVHGFRLGNASVLLGVSLDNGCAGLPPQQTLSRDNLGALRVAGVEWLRSPYRVDNATLRTLQKYDYGYRVLDFLPRVRLMTHTLLSQHPNEDIARIDVVNTVLVNEDVAVAPGLPGTAKLVLDRPGRIRVTTDSPSNQLLVVSESYHSGWQAYSDGRRVRIIRAYGDFMAVPVAAGTHEVEFFFRPLSWRIGRCVSAAGAAALLLLLLIEWSCWHRRRLAGVRNI